MWRRCRRRGGRWAGRGAALALALLGLGLGGGGGGEELLAAALGALGGWGEGAAAGGGAGRGANWAKGAGFAKGGGSAGGANVETGAKSPNFANGGGGANGATGGKSPNLAKGEGAAAGGGSAKGATGAKSANFAGGEGVAKGANVATGAKSPNFAHGGGFANAANLANGAKSPNSAKGEGFANGGGFVNDATGAKTARFTAEEAAATAANLATGAKPPNFAAGGGFAKDATLATGAKPPNFARGGGAANPSAAASAPAASLPSDALLLAPAACGPAPPFLLVLVPSAPAHVAQRSAVRETWGGGGGGGGGGLAARTLFVLGRPGLAAEQAALRAEARRHGDLLQGAFRDAYANLARKTLLLLRWALARCPAVPFLLKADDDVFVNVPALTSYLAAFPAAAPLYLGRVHWWVRPERDPRSRHHVPAALYPAARFPPYCSGTAYVLSRAAAAAVLAAAPRVPFVAPEDVWVGLCARSAGLAPRHSARVAGSARFPPDACCYGEVLFSSHRLRPAELRRAWGMLRGEGGGGCSAWQRALGVLRCRVLAALEWLWG